MYLSLRLSGAPLCFPGRTCQLSKSSTPALFPELLSLLTLLGAPRIISALSWSLPKQGTMPPCTPPPPAVPSILITLDLWGSESTLQTLIQRQPQSSSPAGVNNGTSGGEGKQTCPWNAARGGDAKCYPGLIPAVLPPEHDHSLCQRKGSVYVCDINCRLSRR